MSQDFARVYLEALRHIQAKGQVPSALTIAVLHYIDVYLQREYNVDAALKQFIENYVKYSELERSLFQTVYQKNIETLFSGLKQQVTLQQQTSSPVRIVEELFGRKREQPQQQP